MKVKAQAALTSLKSLSHRVEKLTPDRANADLQNLIVNTIVGCLYIMAQSPTINIRNWLGRKPHRNVLTDAAKAARTKQGFRAIRELIALTISELEASQGSLSQLEVGPLPITNRRGPKRLTAEHLIALHHGRERQLEASRNRMAHFARNKSA